MLEGKRILVTGASGGIGSAVARGCARAGAIVGLGFRASRRQAETLAAEAPESFRLVPFDVHLPEEVDRAITAFVAAEGRVDGLVNAAGVIHPELLAVARTEALRELLETNLLGSLFCARAVLPQMIRQRSGVILNLSSVAAVHPSRGQAAYAATKAGLEALTRGLAVEYGRKGIRAVGIRVGPVATRMLEGTRAIAETELLAHLPFARLGRPEEVADLAVFLLGEKAGYITGSIHTVDGGYLQG